MSGGWTFGQIIGVSMSPNGGFSDVLNNHDKKYMGSWGMGVG